MQRHIQERIDAIRRGEVPQGYKKTPLGMAPNDWQPTVFSELFAEECIFTGDIEQYPLHSLTIEAGVVAKSARYERSHLVKKEDAYKVLGKDKFAYNPMNIRFGAVARNKTGKDVSVSGYYDVFAARHDTDMNFMDSFLASDMMLNYYNKVSTGSLIEKKRVHFSQFIEFVLPLPSAKEREQIAFILNTCDRLIALQEKLIATKERQKKYLMQQLLTGKKRLQGFSEEWRREKLKRILIPGSKERVLNTSQHSKITVKLKLKGVELFCSERNMVDSRPFYIRKKGELIVGKQNYFNGSVAIIPDELDNCICSNAIMSFSVENSDKFYIYSVITQDSYMNRYNHLANGTGQKELSEGDFLDFEILCPSLPEQTAIAAIFSAADKEIDLLKQTLEQEKCKKKALMQLLLTGVVRV